MICPVNIRIRLVLAAVLSAMFLSCSDEKRPEYVMSDSKMVEVLCDYHLAKAMGEVEGADSQKTARLVKSAFEKHNITEAMFDSTLQWYSSNPQLMDKLYEQVVNKLDSERNGLRRMLLARDNTASGTVRGDRVDIWPGMRMFSLNGTEYNDRVTFSFINDRNFEARDTVRLSARFRYFGMPPSYGSPAVMAMSIRYDNDSVIGQSVSVAADGQNTIQLYNDTLGNVKEVHGYIYYPRQQQQQPAVLLVDRVSMMRLHAKSPARTSSAN